MSQNIALNKYGNKQEQILQEAHGWSDIRFSDTPYRSESVHTWDDVDGGTAGVIYSIRLQLI
jgi:hypothetical protein